MSNRDIQMQKIHQEFVVDMAKFKRIMWLNRSKYDW